MSIHITKTEQETEHLGSLLAQQLPDGAVQERTAYEVSVSRLTLESGSALPEREVAAPRPRYTSGVIQ